MLVKSTPPSILSEDLCGNSSNIVKIKVSAPKFSGRSREFAVFKRDFKSIVAVGKRNAVEIGALLKDSIPVEYRYLLDKFELSDHI